MRNPLYHVMLLMFVEAVQLTLTGAVSFRERPYRQLRSDLETAPYSWRPSRGSVVFPPNVNSNAGQLLYKLEDAATFQIAKGTSSSTSPVRTPQAVERPVVSKSQPNNNPSSGTGNPTESGFRPSREYPLAYEIDDSLKEKREYAPNASPYGSAVNENKDVPVKSGRYIDVKTVSPSTQAAEIENLPSITDYADLVDAMEHLVERLNQLELEVTNNRALHSQAQEEKISDKNLQSTLLTAKEKLQDEVLSLMVRTTHVEQRVAALEEITREWIDPTLIDGFDGKSSNKKRTTRTCPEQFFALDENDSSAPCYHINRTPNYRKNWQDASANCEQLHAKLAEPKSSTELRNLANYLLYNRTDQLGGGYWTGGLNPGLVWLWPTSGNTLNDIDPELWLTSPENSSVDAKSGKCLRLSYDRTSERYALQGSDCQRYLYFVCEYDFNVTVRTGEKFVNAQTSVQNFETTTVSSLAHRTTLRSLPWPAPKFTAQVTSTQSTFTTTPTPLPPTPNYVGVIGFKGIPPKQRNENPLNLAILVDNNS